MQGNRALGEEVQPPPQCSCLGNESQGPRAWRATGHGVERVRRDRATELTHTEAREPLQEAGKHPFLAVEIGYPQGQCSFIESGFLSYILWGR